MSVQVYTQLVLLSYKKPFFIRAHQIPSLLLVSLCMHFFIFKKENNISKFDTNKEKHLTIHFKSNAASHGSGLSVILTLLSLLSSPSSLTLSLLSLACL